MPPKICESTDVPPATATALVVARRNPLVHDWAVATLMQNRKGSWTADAFIDRSGRSRDPSEGVPTCQAGLLKKPLTPPPPASKMVELVVVLSFQIVSGI